jgi:hypothetical protein
VLLAVQASPQAPQSLLVESEVSQPSDGSLSQFA